MAVIVDKPGRDDPTVGVDRPLGGPAQFPDLGDFAVLDPDIAAESRHSRPVDDAPVLDQQIVCHRYPFLSSFQRSVTRRAGRSRPAKSTAWSSSLAWLGCGGTSG